MTVTYLPYTSSIFDEHVRANFEYVESHGIFDSTALSGVLSGTLPHPSGPPLVTALPSNPSDGDEVYYIASNVQITSGILWHMRYRAGQTFPWQFVGGSDVLLDPNVSNPTLVGVSATGPWFASTDPTYTVPWHGYYDVTVKATIVPVTPNVDYEVAFGPMSGGGYAGTSGWSGLQSVANNSSGYYGYNPNVVRDRVGLPAGAVLSSGVAVIGPSASNMNLYQNSLMVRPIIVTT